MHFGDWLSNWHVNKPRKWGLIDSSSSETRAGAMTPAHEYIGAGFYEFSACIVELLSDRNLRKCEQAPVLASNSGEHFKRCPTMAKQNTMGAPLNHRLMPSDLKYLLTSFSSSLFSNQKLSNSHPTRTNRNQANLTKKFFHWRD